MRVLGGGAPAALVATLIAALAASAADGGDASGINPHPVYLVRPPAAPLSAMAQLGRAVFFDRSLSGSGRLSCASCHSPQHAYGPPGSAPVMDGGASLSRAGVRAVPSLMYLERQPPFSVGPDDSEAENAAAPARAQVAASSRVQKTVPALAKSATALVPQGGLFWDGRADTLQSQALSPLLNPLEMDAGSVGAIARRLRHAPYAGAFAELFGAPILRHDGALVGEAMFAVGRFQIEDRSFHPYSSKFDLWLEGKVRLSAAEMRGYRIFNDPHAANCAACHLDAPTRDGLPPLFTDHQYEALGVPRNGLLPANRDRAYFDLGLCGPVRTDLRAQSQNCGLFATPSLRNAATRHAYFHNGVYRSLGEVLDFYDFRDTRPRRIYPRDRAGNPQSFDDLPPAYQGNVDRTDPPLDRVRGESPVMTVRDEDDVIAFLHTLTDGYDARRGPAGHGKAR